jgi:hypothetical protein
MLAKKQVYFAAVEAEELQALTHHKRLGIYLRKLLQRKEVNPMKYETPELTALTLAINAIQAGGGKGTDTYHDSNSGEPWEATSAYADWE